jgi:hypothetical protein
MTDKKPQAGWFGRLRERRRAKHQRAAKRAHQESRHGVPKQGSGAPRHDTDAGGFVGG